MPWPQKLLKMRRDNNLEWLRRISIFVGKAAEVAGVPRAAQRTRTAEAAEMEAENKWKKAAPVCEKQVAGKEYLMSRMWVAIGDQGAKASDKLHKQWENCNWHQRRQLEKRA